MRVPPGTPTGGQFATGLRAEPPVTLAAPTADPSAGRGFDPTDPWAPHYLSPDYDPGEPPFDDFVEAQPTTFDCPKCDGSGEISDGTREWDTGAYITRECWFCDGTGEVDADGVAFHDEHRDDD